jgi:ribosomal protein S18 acetylase RimI-like enzyme
MEALIRPARREDAERAAELILEPPGGLHDIFHDRARVFRVARAAFLAAGSAMGCDRALVAEDDGGVVGFMARFPGSQWPRLRVSTGLAMVRASLPFDTLALLRRGRAQDRGMAPVASTSLYVMSLAVAPERRSRGIGARLLHRALDEARLLGLRSVALDVARDNVRAIEFYRREEFVPVDPSIPGFRGARAGLRMVRSVRAGP